MITDVNTPCLDGAVVLPKTVSGWSSLFKKRPGNEGSYVLKQYNVFFWDNPVPPPKEVIDAGIAFWKNYLVGFFFDEAPYLLYCEKPSPWVVETAWYDFC